MLPNEHDEDRLLELVELFERESKLIAYDLHDGLAQLIVGAKLQLDSINCENADLDQKTKGCLIQARTHLDEAIHESRLLIGDLRANSIDWNELPIELSRLVNRFRKGPLEILEQVDLESGFGSKLSGSIYRIVQESLQNIEKHSNADFAAVLVGGNKNEIRIMIADNGVGWEKEKRTGEKWGLEGIRFRCQLFSGSVQFISVPAGGPVNTHRPMTFGQEIKKVVEDCFQTEFRQNLGTALTERMGDNGSLVIATVPTRSVGGESVDETFLR